MKQAKRILSIALCTILLLSLCGCGTTRNRETGSGYTTGTTSYQANNYAMYDYNEEAVAMEDYGGFAPLWLQPAQKLLQAETDPIWRKTTLHPI